MRPSDFWEIALYVFVGMVIVGSAFVWWGASEDCSKKHGVLVKDAVGMPACVPGAK